MDSTRANSMSIDTAQCHKATKKDKTAAHGSNTAFVDLPENELDALIHRIEEARTHELSLSAGDYELLLGAIMMLANLQERLESNELTIHKLKKLLGMVRSSESLGDLTPNSDQAPNGSGKSPSGSGEPRPKRERNRGKPKKKPPAKKPDTHEHPLKGMSKGDRCPGCGAGKLYKYTPAVLLRVTGHAPLSCHKHVAQQMRCNGCNEIFTADLPEHVKADGSKGQLYGFSACSVMAIYKYFAANPFFRQGTINSLLGMPVAASTIFDQCEKVANALNPIFKIVKQQAANAQLFYLDDTTNRILGQKPVMKVGRDGRTRQRSGIYTSAVLAITDAGERLVLFQTNIGHAGEWMQEILTARDPTRATPLLMSDALSANHVTGHPFHKCLCNSHGRRGFVDLVDKSPNEAVYALELYKHAWANESHCVENQFSPEQRLAYHREHSLPPMQELLSWCQDQLQSDTVEHNSNLGKAMNYIIRHFDGLTAFCRIEGSPIDNNEIERMIKIIVRNRKNSLFFKTAVGADISDVITSMLAICHENDIDALHYLTSIQRNQFSVRASPEKWLPWNYPTEK